MRNIFIDIETVPGCPWMAEDLAASVQAPANYTKPATIAEYRKEKAMDLERGLALHPLYAQVVAIGVAMEGGRVDVLTHQSPVQLLQDLGNKLADLAYQADMLSHEGFRFIGHNVLGFDLPVLWAQAMRHNVAIPYLPNPQKLKPWTMGDKLLDTMLAMKPSLSPTRGWGLADMCRLLGIPDPMPEVDGSMVWDLWQRGRMDELTAYCANDVHMTRQLFTRMSPWLDLT